MRIDLPGIDHYGHVRITIDPGRELEALCFALAGEIGTGKSIAWPPRREKEGDEGNAAMLVARLRMDEQGWDDAHRLVREISSLPPVRTSAESSRTGSASRVSCPAPRSNGSTNGANDRSTLRLHRGLTRQCATRAARLAP